MFLKCSCQSHAINLAGPELEIEKGEPLDNEWYLSVWYYGRQTKVMSWKERIRWIWRILRTGNPWADEIILNYPEMIQLKDYIEKETKEFEKRVTSNN